MTSQSKSQSNSGFNRRFFLAGAAAGAMIPVAAGAAPNPLAHGHPGGRGLWKKKAGGSSVASPADVKVADVSYQNDELAGLIVRIWKDQPTNFRDSLLTGSPLQRMANAQTALQTLPLHPIYLASPIVITEDEYDAGWEADNDDQIVFVLPNRTRQVGDLLENAKLLMAAIPNGI
jgi:hypothetical protein